MLADRQANVVVFYVHFLSNRENRVQSFQPLNKAKQKYMCVSGFILRINRVGRSDLIFIFFF